MSTENFKNKSFKTDQLSKCPFTGAGTPAKFSAGRGQTVRDFWPNSLNLKILSQHSNLSNPMDKKFSYAKEFKKIKDQKIKIDNQEIKEIITVNGVRFSFEDGSWGLIRASSNKPSLVVVTESPTSDERKLNIFKFIDKTLMKTGKIGEYDQKI